MKNLNGLLKGVKDHTVYGVDISVKGVSSDSRENLKDKLFIAIRGQNYDAHKFIPEAIKKGVKAIVGEIEPNQKWLKNITYVKVTNSRYVLGIIASNWFDNPSSGMKVIGVTGSDGKTTTTNFIYNILKTSGYKTGMVSTISAKIGEKEYDTGFHVTNPEPIQLQTFLRKMKDNKITHVVLEVTSHGLDQDRVAGIDFDIAVVTNITHEHLDYHKTYENYLAAKAKLFEMSKISVLNKDDRSFENLKVRIKNKIVTYAVEKEADFKAVDISFDIKTEYRLLFGGEDHPIRMDFRGIYNVSNSLAAIAVARQLDIGWQKIAEGLENTPIPEGRLNKIDNDLGIEIYVDFAHTPNALASVLKLLKDTTKKRLISVFGCAGERDVAKRFMMGEISAGLADISVFTAEDPRSEDVNEIIKEMKRGAFNAGSEELSSYVDREINGKLHKIVSIPERGEAIYTALRKIAREGDTVVIAGKGHEMSMCYNGVEYPWSDKEAVKEALKGKIKEIKRK